MKRIPSPSQMAKHNLKAMSFVAVFFLAIAGFEHAYSMITLTPNVTNFAGEVCPETVQFTCVAIDIEATLAWTFQNMSNSSKFSNDYALNTMDRFPRTDFESDNITIVIESAVQNPLNLDRANFTSTLTVSLSSLIYLGVQRVVCGTSLLNGSFPMNLNGVAVRAPPPHPVFTCSIADDGGSVTFNWNSSYNSNYSVNHYCLDSAACSSCSISPTAPYVCEGLQIGQEHTIIFQAVNCDVQRGAAENVVIDLPGTTQPPRNVEVVSLFNSSVLTQVTVKWSADGDQYSNKCDHKATTYIVTLQNTINASVEQEVDVDSCESSMCSTDIPISEPGGSYSISVRAVSIIGTNSTTFPSVIPANSMSLLRTILNFTNCITYATCSSDVVEDGNCGIRYSSISDSGSTTGMLNSTFSLPLLTPNARYDLVTNLTINSGFTVKVETTFITGNFDPRLTRSNIIMIVVGSIFTVVAIVCEICGAIAVVHICSKCLGTRLSCERSHADEHMGTSIDFHNGCGLTTPMPPPDESFVCIGPPHYELSNRTNRPVLYCMMVVYGLSLILVCVAIVIWMSLGGIVGQQQNTCEVSWQTSRDNLTAASLVFSILSLIVYIVFVPMFMWSKKDNKVSAWLRDLMSSHKDEEVYSAEDKTAEDEQESVIYLSYSSPKQGQLNQQGPDSLLDGNQESCTSQMTAHSGNDDNSEEHHPIAPMVNGVQQEESFFGRMHIFGDQLQRVKDELPFVGIEFIKQEECSNQKPNQEDQASNGPEVEEGMQENNHAVGKKYERSLEEAADENYSPPMHKNLYTSR